VWRSGLRELEIGVVLQLSTRYVKNNRSMLERKNVGKLP
jgi:DNA-binding CsgD family transcriptional regulator